MIKIKIRVSLTSAFAVAQRGRKRKPMDSVNDGERARINNKVFLSIHVTRHFSTYKSVGIHHIVSLMSGVKSIGLWWPVVRLDIQQKKVK